jgi:hypothetical protein
MLPEPATLAGPTFPFRQASPFSPQNPLAPLAPRDRLKRAVRATFPSPRPISLVPPALATPLPTLYPCPQCRLSNPLDPAFTRSAIGHYAVGKRSMLPPPGKFETGVGPGKPRPLERVGQVIPLASSAAAPRPQGVFWIAYTCNSLPIYVVGYYEEEGLPQRACPGLLDIV